MSWSRYGNCGLAGAARKHGQTPLDRPWREPGGSLTPDRIHEDDCPSNFVSVTTPSHQRGRTTMGRRPDPRGGLLPHGAFPLRRAAPMRTTEGEQTSLRSPSARHCATSATRQARTRRARSLPTRSTGLRKSLLLSADDLEVQRSVGDGHPDDLAGAATEERRSDRRVVREEADRRVGLSGSDDAVVKDLLRRQIAYRDVLADV